MLSCTIGVRKSASRQTAVSCTIRRRLASGIPLPSCATRRGFVCVLDELRQYPVHVDAAEPLEGTGRVRRRALTAQRSLDHSFNAGTITLRGVDALNQKLRSKPSDEGGLVVGCAQRVGRDPGGKAAFQARVC